MMTPRIGHLPPGEELMDAETFVSLHSTHVVSLEPPSAGRRVARPWMPDVAAIDSGPPPLHSQPACPSRSDGAEQSGERPRPRVSPAAAAALEAEIDGCSSREHVAQLAVHLARAYSPAACLFLVHRGMIERIRAEGSSSDGGALLFPADASNLFAEVVASGEPYRGAPPEGGFEDRILRVLGRQHVQEIALLPVSIRGRVVNLLYVDNGPEALGDASVAALAVVCARVSRAYERLILERKAGAPDAASVSS
jgi:hypothetical protein